MQSAQNYGFFRIIFLALPLTLFAFGAGAQDAVIAEDEIDILPAKSLEGTDMEMAADLNSPTHGEVRLTPDKSEIITLDGKASTIIVGNPTHLSIMADSAERLVLVPRTPGATYFSVLDKNGKVIMQRHVIVASPKEKYMRIRKSCAGSDADSCNPTQVYYCPDMCHQILTSEEDPNAGSPDAAALDAQTSGQGGQPDEEDVGTEE